MCSFKFYWSVSIKNDRKKCKHESKSDLRHIIFERSMPEKFRKGKVSIIYGVLKDIFSIIEDRNRSERFLSLSNIPDCLNLLCGRDVGNLAKKPRSFLSKIKVYQK